MTSRPHANLIGAAWIGVWRHGERSIAGTSVIRLQVQRLLESRTCISGASLSVSYRVQDNKLLRVMNSVGRTASTGRGHRRCGSTNAAESSNTGAAVAVQFLS